MKIQSKRKIIIIASIAFLLCAIASIFAVWKLNKYHLELSVSEKTITLEYGVDKMPDITALCKGSLINRKGNDARYADINPILTATILILTSVLTAGRK